MQYSFIDENQNDAIALEQQRQFLQDGKMEQQNLIVQNVELCQKAAYLLTSRHLMSLLHPYQEHSARSDAEILVRYHQTLSEIDQTRVDIATLETRANQEQVVLHTSLEEIDRQCQELEVSFKLIREAAASLQQRAFGVALTQQDCEQFEAVFVELVDKFESLRLSQVDLEEKIKQLQLKMKKKDQTVDKSKVVDFEQIKIENQTLAEKIEERSEDLLKLRRKTVSTLQILAHVREKRHFVYNQVQKLKQEYVQIESEAAKLREKLGVAKTKRNNIRQEAEESRDQTGLTGNPMLVADYKRREKDVQGLHGVMEERKKLYSDLCRKCDLARQSQMQYQSQQKQQRQAQLQGSKPI